MIASLSGQIKAIRDGALIVEVAGVGYHVHVVQSLLDEDVRVGQKVELFTHMVVRENALALYGFRSHEEHELFVMLLGVSGIGPRTALATLSTLSPEVLRSAIGQEDAFVLTRIPGIGRKTAQRLLLDLKDRVGVAAVTTSTSGLSEADVDVINALTGLGYSLVEAQQALSAIPEEMQELDERIIGALRYLGGR